MLCITCIQSMKSQNTYGKIVEFTLLLLLLRTTTIHRCDATLAALAYLLLLLATTTLTRSYQY
jgi:hypothetical protein